MKLFVQKILQKQKFQPDWRGIFINPYYFTRKGLYKGIRKNTCFLSGKLLDFGCGDKPYKNIIKVEEYVGMDIEVSGHDHENEKIDIFYDGKNIPFNNESFDSIFSSEVFEHVFNLDVILKELNRVCKKGGNLLVTVPFVWNEHEIPYDFGRYTSFGIKFILEKHGFEIVKSSKTTNYVESLFQMWNTYIFQRIFRNKTAQSILTPIVIGPITLMGIIISKILPTDNSLFLNNIIVAKKIRSGSKEQKNG